LRLARFIHGGKILDGRIEDGKLVGNDGSTYSDDAITWLPPAIPNNIIGLVLNYADHADELGLSPSNDPIIFLKPTSTLVGHLAPVILPLGAKYVHYEGELAVVIGKNARHVGAREALDYVVGYTIANDVTVRDYITNTFRPPVRAKGFDTFCPLGPFLVSKDEVPDSGNLSIVTKVNGVAKQSGNTKMFLHPLEKVIEFITSFMTLKPGDVILTGTPKGISPLAPGDEVQVTIESLGTLTNRVAQESPV
jgi:5-oxopent-3-ene-1,2,5-tricarboxylate decarboxylase/2-hydroxyhepta-2,4-diene-1,7-dioate isomerase